VNALPTARISPTSVTLNVGQSQTFTATISEGTGPYSYQWYSNGTAVSGATGSTWKFAATSAGSNTVHVVAADSDGEQATSNSATATVGNSNSNGLTIEIIIIFALIIVVVVILTFLAVRARRERTENQKQARPITSKKSNRKNRRSKKQRPSHR
jgi:flagellar biosynthesis/type III secretory pathway M-ring protein FliF/YscJ